MKLYKNKRTGNRLFYKAKERARCGSLSCGDPVWYDFNTRSAYKLRPEPKNRRRRPLSDASLIVTQSGEIRAKDMYEAGIEVNSDLKRY